MSSATAHNEAFLADVLRRFRASFPRVGFLLVGTSAREVPQLLEFLDREHLNDAVCVTGSVPHDLFLTMMPNERSNPPALT